MKDKIMKYKKVLILLYIVLIIILFIIIFLDYNKYIKSNSNDNKKIDNKVNNNGIEEENNEISDDIKETDTYKYYEENSSSIEKVMDAKNEEYSFSEKEAKMILEERGFKNYPINYDFSLDGEYVDETEVDPSSNKKHPMYLTNYQSKDGSIWTVYLISKSIFAYPASYILNNSPNIEILLSETSTITSYDSETNAFFVTIPNGKKTKGITIEKITSSSLDNYKFN
ncbi:MAG: hypothetical protein VZS44_03305 [Bacilli bacterium]|nr:hypothetical protein [Bacilli bacterium]